MDPDELLRAALLADEPFTALIGGAGDLARFYWDEPPSWEQLGLVVVHEIPSDGQAYHLTGRDNLSQWWRQVDCWSTTPLKAKAIRKRLLAADGPIEALNTPPLQAFIRRTYAGRDKITGPNSDRTTTLYRASLDLQLWFTEST
jgi:hypothetical protein